MTNKRFFPGILAVILVFGMALTGCDNGSKDGGGSENDITYTVTANSNTETTAVNFVFSAAVSGLTASDITVTDGTGSVTKGTLTGSGQNWSLGVTVNTAGNISVKITKSGIESGTKTVAVAKGSSGDGSVSIEMVQIPAGTFIMGSPSTEPNRGGNETQHSVTLTKSFYMSKHLVTQAQYQAVMGAGEDRTTTTYGKGDNYPIYYVNWYDAIVFCNKLSVMEGLDPVYSIGGSTDPAAWIASNGGSIPTSGNATWNAAEMDMSKNGYRLPTEAEWEYACRGSYTNKATETNTKPFGIGDGTKMVSGMANFDGRSPYDLNHAPPGEYIYAGGTYLGKTTEVGSYAANNYGLYDMHGNLCEWCWDWYKADITADTSDPTGAVTGSNRVVRGGPWSGGGRYLRSAYRDYHGQNYRDKLIGFRLVRS